MPVKPVRLGAVVCAISVTIIMLLSSAPLGSITLPEGSTDVSDPTRKESQAPAQLSAPVGLPGVIEPGEPIPDVPVGDSPPGKGELRRLAELEGKCIFENVRPGYYRNNYGSLWLRCDGASIRDTDQDGLRLYTGNQPERTVEEADVVKVDGDRLYVLNPYKGFMVFDLSDPLHPAFIGRAPILGNPFEMYVVGSKAYVIVTASYGWWYHNTWRGSYGIQAVLDDGIGTDESFYVGSKVLVIDLADESDPKVVARFGLEGEVTDSRRVGDVIYFVSNVYGWYRRSTDGTTGEDMTSVMALDMADPRSPRVEDRVTFQSVTNVIHVSQQYVFVAQNPAYPGSWSDRTTITIVDIRDPHGTMTVRGSYDLAGRVSDRYQLDCYEDMLRVVSFVNANLGSSTLAVLDIDDPDNPAMLGSLEIADAGDLMATRFAGERAYTIHLPRPVRTDPLDVIDLGDPSNPRLCDVLEIPGWVTHIEVRGYRLLALGVDSTTWPQGVSMSLFDVTDPDEAVLLSRVKVGDGSVWSTANNDPKALTVIDERGLVLVPFVSSVNDRWSNPQTSKSGVQVIEFDLEDGALRLAGCFEQPDNVIRTRAVGEAVVATSSYYLLAVDLENVGSPVVASTIDFRSEVLDLFLHDGQAAAVVRSGDGRMLELRTLRSSDTEAMSPIASERLGVAHGTWGWQGDDLLFLHTEYLGGSPRTTLQAYELEDGGMLRRAGVCTLTNMYSFYTTGTWPTAGREGTSVTSWQSYGTCIDEAVLLLNGVVVVKDASELSIIDIRDIDHPCVRSQYHLEVDYVFDIRAMGSRLFITYGEAVADSTEKPSDHYGRRVVDNRERYYLMTLELDDLESPRASHPVNIPGIPVGVSDDGQTVYTVAYWKAGDDGTYTKTLNVVRLLGVLAVLWRAIEINMTSMVAMDGDLAYVLTPGADGSRRYYYGDMDHYLGYYPNPRISWPYGTSGPSELWVIDLGSWSAGRVIAYTEVGKSCSAMYIIGGSLVLDLGDQEGLVVMRLAAMGGMRLVGSYETTGEVNSIRQFGDRAYLAQGEFGTTSFALM